MDHMVCATAQVQGAAPNGRREGLDQGRELLTSCISFPGSCDKRPQTEAQNNRNLSSLSPGD